MSTEYFSIDGAPGRYFVCGQLKATLSVPSCSGRWKESQGGKRFETCRTCALGAEHSGRKMAVKPAKTMCCRCADLATRLVDGGVCMSCYNRQREVEKGKNGKGSAPRPVDVFFGNPNPTKVVVLHDVSVRVVNVAGRTSLVPSRSASPVEAIVRAIRKFVDSPAFVPRAGRHPMQQLNLLF